MKTNWDYTELADAYLKRPDYSDEAINKMVSTAGLKKDDLVCDVGAGVAHLTIKLAERGLKVMAVEPNDAMRKNGINRTKKFANVKWFEGTGENTNQPDGQFNIVTFGSSFNVTDRQQALKETKRILKPSGWFACMWNHRELNDKIQLEIEGIIKSNINNYDYGTRREDQTIVIDKSGYFGSVYKIEAPVIHVQSLSDCIEAWQSHATLQRQAGEKFHTIVSEIEKFLKSLKKSEIEIPYTTRIWMAQLK